MRIEGISAVFPSRKLTNNDLVELIRVNSEGKFDGDLSSALLIIRRLLAYSGAEQRYWLGHDERPIDLILQAANGALAKASIEADEIELLIFVGVDRGFNEPGNSYFVANALKMVGVHCFDLLDACMSWSRALHIIDSLFRAGAYRSAMIVNGEFNQTHKGGPTYPKTFSLRDPKQIEWTWPGYTVGEAATATVLTNKPNEDWTFSFSSRNDLADLCSIPTEGYEDYCLMSDRIGRNGFGSFTSFGKKMHEAGTLEVRKVFEKLGAPITEIRAIFPHASSKRSWDEAARPLGFEHLLYHIYPKYGNLVSASIPAALARAIEAGAFKRGDKGVGWLGSTGMSFAAYSFVY